MDRFARAARCIRRPLGVLRSAGLNPVRSRAAGSLASAALLAQLLGHGLSEPEEGGDGDPLAVGHGGAEEHGRPEPGCGYRQR